MKLFFEEDRKPVHFDLPDANLIYYPCFFTPERADELWALFSEQIAWRQESIALYGKILPQPRLTAFYATQGRSYSYSGLSLQPNPWTPALEFVRSEIETVCRTQFTSVLANLYRDGNDSMGWHADNEKELGIDPVIASVSLGAERVFHLRHNRQTDQRFKLLLEHGSLLIMSGATQHHWQHQLPKSTRVMGPRINLTFRVID